MDYNSIPTEFFIAHVKSFSDAFPKISIREEEWGLIFEWPNSIHITTNFALIDNDSINVMGNLLGWMKEDPTRKILIPQDIKFQGKTTKIYEIGIYFRKQKKIRSPILETESAKSYSYRTISSEYNLKEIMNIFAEIVEIPEESVFEFHQLIGGNMHLNEGEIWMLDNDGAVLSVALAVEQPKFKNIKLIDLLTTRESVRRKGHAANLLQSIIAKGQKYDYIVVTKKTPIHEKLLEKFSFNLTKSYNVHILEQ